MIPAWTAAECCKGWPSARRDHRAALAGRAARRAADRGAGDVELGRELVAAREDELRRQVDLAHVAVDSLLDPLDHLLAGAADPVFESLGRLRRGRQLGAGDEDVVLEAEDVAGQLPVIGLRANATYYYRVGTYNGCATSSNSSIKSVQTSP